jgi:hypothetical protein
MIYVDELRKAKWRYTRSCHLLCDTEECEELHWFAASIGLRLEYFQDKKIPHYDLTAKKRMQAIKLGAKEILLKDYLKMREV